MAGSRRYRSGFCTSDPRAYAWGYYLPPLRGLLNQTVEIVFGPGVNQETGLDRKFYTLNDAFIAGWKNGTSELGSGLRSRDSQLKGTDKESLVRLASRKIASLTLIPLSQLSAARICGRPISSPRRKLWVHVVSWIQAREASDMIGRVSWQAGIYVPPPGAPVPVVATLTTACAVGY